MKILNILELSKLSLEELSKYSENCLRRKVILEVEKDKLGVSMDATLRLLMEWKIK